MIEAAMIWNEPNNKSHWDLEQDPGQKHFERMARLAGQAIHAEAPRLSRVMGGISPIDFGLIRSHELLAGKAPRIHWYSLYDLPPAWEATTRHKEAEFSPAFRHHAGCPLQERCFLKKASVRSQARLASAAS